jgi:hypothetical protein
MFPRAHFRFLAVLALTAFLALGAAGTASAKKKNKPLKPNSVTSITIKDGEVNTADLAGAAVTATQLAAQAVGTSALEDNAVIGAKVQDDSLTGDDVNEGSLKFGCAPIGNQQVEQVAGAGFCAFVIRGTNATWAAASALCRQTLPAAGLPSSDELYLAVTGSNAQSPFRDVAAAFTEDMLAGNNPAALLTFSNGSFTSSNSGTLSLSLSQVVCTFNPSDRNG